jgi:hypothetical protein
MISQWQIRPRRPRRNCAADKDGGDGRTLPRQLSRPVRRLARRRDPRLTPVKLHSLPHPRCWWPPSASSVLQRGHGFAAHPDDYLHRMEPFKITIEAPQSVSGLFLNPPDARACFVFAHGAGVFRFRPRRGRRHGGRGGGWKTCRPRRAWPRPLRRPATHSLTTAERRQQGAMVATPPRLPCRVRPFSAPSLAGSDYREAEPWRGCGRRAGRRGLRTPRPRAGASPRRGEPVMV